VGQVSNLLADFQSALRPGLQTRAQDTILPHNSYVELLRHESFDLLFILTTLALS